MSRTRIYCGSVLRAGTMLAALVAAHTVVGQTSIENDDCQNATPITDGTYQGTTDGATLDGDPGCSGLCLCFAGSGRAPDVWYLYTAICDGVLDVDTCDSGFDTWLSIHEPGCSGVELACDDDGCGSTYQSHIQTVGIEGEDYLIRVSGWDAEVGEFTLNVSCTPREETPYRPGRDHCEGARQLEVPTIVRGTTEGADYDPEADRNIPGFPQTQGNWGNGRDSRRWRGETPGVWYRVTGTGNRMTASVDNPGTVVGANVQVYCDGCDRPLLVSGGSNYGDPGKDSDAGWATWCSRPGETYRIWVAAPLAGTVGDFELSVSDDGTPCYGAVDCTPVEVIDTYVSDNGDHDGWADTNETVEMRFTVANRSSRDVTGLVARLSTDDPRVAGLGESEVHIGTLGAGETRLAPGAFTFRVADVERAGADDDFSADLRVGFVSDQFEDLSPRRCAITGVECEDNADCTGSDFCDHARCAISGGPCSWGYDCAMPEAGDSCVGRCSISGLTCVAGDSSPAPCEDAVDFCVDETQRLRLDLDLDAAGGSGSTEFFESFESGGPAAIQAMNLDAGLNSLEAAEGYHCQYSPADDGWRVDLACFPGANPVQAAAYFWQLDDGRAFSGLRSLYMGIEFEPGEYTTPLSNLEAAAIAQPINLDAASSCSGDQDDACTGDGDCAPGERCLAVIPELSFKHQISLVDDRAINTRGQGSASSGVVQIQVLDAAGAPIGPWQTIEPKVNRYDSVPTAHFFQCYFDPIDDGSTEYDRFGYIGADPPIGMIGMRYLSVGAWYVPHANGVTGHLGPSSICFPQRAFASAGDTDDPFDPNNLNGPVVGPGLQGELGVGTWVEPVFSLDRYRGRRVRVRFLTNGFKDNLRFAEDYRSYLGNDSSLDDGWWIDDVRVTHTLTEPATVTPDTKDNSALALDADGDGVADTADCMPAGDQVWALPGEVVGLRMSHAGGVGGTTTLSWDRAATLGAAAVGYVVITEDGTSCSESNVGTSHEATDAVTPQPGALRRFLVQAANACGRGPLGTSSLHALRTGCE